VGDSQPKNKEIREETIPAITAVTVGSNWPLASGLGYGPWAVRHRASDIRHPTSGPMGDWEMGNGKWQMEYGKWGTIDRGPGNGEQRLETRDWRPETGDQGPCPRCRCRCRGRCRHGPVRSLFGVK